MSRPDPNSAQRRAADPGSSVWVAASAGTGKTKVLTDRVLALLLAGTPPERILCLTFTKAAAAEMANRVAARLAKWATSAEDTLKAELFPLIGGAPDAQTMTAARRLFARLLDAPGGMRIETIHAFCQSLLRRFPLEVGLAPHFQVMDDRDAGELLADAREEMLARAQLGADPLLAQSLTHVTERIHEQRFPELMAGLANDRGRLLGAIRRLGGTEALVAALGDRLGLVPGETAESLIGDFAKSRQYDEPEWRDIASALLAGKASDAERGRMMADWLAEPAARAERFDLWRLSFLTKEDTPRAKLCTAPVEEARPGTRTALETEAERVYDLIDRLRALASFELTAALLRLALCLIEIYQRHKASRALLDYDDLILAAIGLLTADNGAAWVLYKLDGGIDHLLIDEAQDTNPDQWAVIRALSDEFFAGEGRSGAGKRTIFAVGDAKQSIYSFQRADPREFEASRQILAQRVPLAGGKWDQVELAVSFRSARPVLKAVDLVLEGAGGAGVAPPGEKIEHLLWREGAAGRVEIWPPTDPKPQDAETPWKPPVERREGDNPLARLARLVAGRIHRMISAPEILDSKGRPIQPGDILVLVRRRNAFVDHLVRALKRFGVPVAGADRMVLTEQLAVMDLMALARILLLPEDDLTLATVLKGPLIGLSEEELFELAWNRKGTLWQALRDSRFARARDTLAGLAALADRWTPHRLFSHVLVQGGKERLLSRLGPEAEDPLDEFLSLTLAYEQMHPPSLQGFLHWLEEGGNEIKRDLDQGSGAIRIMTVHGAKGLQAPIVFLPDTLQKPRRRPALLWLDPDGAPLPLWPGPDGLDRIGAEAQAAADSARDAEYRRLLYVAMTRAEDRLYVCGWNRKQRAPEDCWYALIEQAIAPVAEKIDDAFLGQTVLSLSAPQSGAVESALGAAPKAAVAPLPGWARLSAPAEPIPPRPLAPSRPEPAPPRRESPGQKGDQSGRRRGILIHRLLQSLPDLPQEARAQAAARFLGRPAWELSFAEQAEIAGEVGSVLADPRFADLFGPQGRAEIPLIGRLGERVVSGRVDRLLVRPDEVLVVDFKTELHPPSAPPIGYIRQMAAYRGILACLYPGRTIRCALLWTALPLWMPLEHGALDDALAALAALTDPSPNPSL